MHTFFALLCFVVVIHWLIFPYPSDLLHWHWTQSNDCPSAGKATLMNMDKYFMWIHYERLHNHNKAKHNKTVCIFLGMYCSCCQVNLSEKGWAWMNPGRVSFPSVCKCKVQSSLYRFIGPKRHVTYIKQCELCVIHLLAWRSWIEHAPDLYTYLSMATMGRMSRTLALKLQTTSYDWGDSCPAHIPEIAHRRNTVFFFTYLFHGHLLLISVNFISIQFRDCLSNSINIHSRYDYSLIL